MDKDLFDQLSESIREAGAVLREEQEPARSSSFEADAVAAALDSPNPRTIRGQLSLCRGQFAALIGVSERTVEGWEQGRRRPSGPAFTLLRVAAKHPESVLDTMRQVTNQSAT